MKLSLSRKIVLLAATPLAVVVALASLTIRDNWQRKNVAETIAKSTQFFEKTSLLVHELQKERGRSSQLLSGTIARTDLDGQRALTDQMIPEYQQTLARLPFDAKNRENAEQLAQLLRNAREKADAKASRDELIAAYTATIDAAHELMMASTQLASLDGIETALLSLILVEDAKENAGRLRATLSAVFAADQPIPFEKLSTIEQYKAAFMVNLNSPVLFLSDTGKQTLDVLVKSNEWNNVQAALIVVAHFANQGHYSMPQDMFFKNATQVIDGLQSILKGEFSALMDRANQAENQARRSLMATVGSLCLLLLLLAAASWRFVQNLASTLDKITGTLTSRSRSVAETADQVTSASHELNSSVNQQAQALQTTASSIHEISTMVERNAENAQRSREISDRSRGAAEQGKEAVTAMINAMEEISVSNAEAFAQMEAGNRDISSVVKVISEIGEKTKIINDIVFQTRLLSFNASVEAARAGDAGKGFAVVADEVGKLAQVSGTAAREINEMLEKGIQQVDGVVTSTQERVTKLAGVGKEKIAAGSSTAALCAKSLNAIVTDVIEVSEAVSSIASASAEQAVGIREITRSIEQLEHGTQKTAATSTQSARAGEALLTQARGLNDAAESLARLVGGDRVAGGQEEGEPAPVVSIQSAHSQASKKKAA